MQEREQRIPTPKAVVAIFGICFALIVVVGGLFELSATPGFLASIYVAEWLIVVPPILYLARSEVTLRESLSLKKPSAAHILLGFIAGIGGLFIFLELLLIMETILGSYPQIITQILASNFPNDPIHFLAWVG